MEEEGALSLGRLGNRFAEGGTVTVTETNIDSLALRLFPPTQTMARDGQVGPWRASTQRSPAGAPSQPQRPSYGAASIVQTIPVENDGGYMEVDGGPPGPFESDVALLTDTGTHRRQSDVSLITDTGFAELRRASDVQL